MCAMLSLTMKHRIPRDHSGKFRRKDKAFYGTYVDTKGYISICAGPFRGMRLHTLIAIAMNHRLLKKDEDAHHGGKHDKLNPCPLCSLEVLGHKQHGWVSKMQHQFMLRKEAEDRKLWEQIHGPPPQKNEVHSRKEN